jgi:hypothetical protein
MNFAFLKTDVSKRAALAVLALLLVAGIVTGREKPTLAVPERPSRIETKIEPAEDIDLSRLERPAAEAPHNDPFARRSFAPPAPQLAAAEPSRPVAPPLPFRYMGRLTEHGKTEVFLLRGEEILSIAPGQKIDAQYRVDAVSASAIQITYLPLKTRQSLELAQ